MSYRTECHFLSTFSFIAHHLSHPGVSICFETRYPLSRLHNHSVTCLLSLALASSLDESRQIADWKVEWEVDSCQELHEKQIPAQQADDEGKSTSSGEQDCMSTVGEKVACQAAESWHKEEEDEEENDVRADRYDEVDEAEDTHVDLEERERALKDWISCGSGWVRWQVCDRGIVVWCKRCSEGQPESTECAENDEWEGVAQDELED